MWKRGVAIVLVLVTPTAFSAQVPGFDMYTWGYLDYTARYSAQSTNSRETLRHLTMLQLNTAGYLVQPWLLRYNTGLGLSYNTSSGEEDASVDSQVINGHINLNVLPKSIFPLFLFAEHQDNRADGDTFGRDFTRTSYGFRQGYRPLDGGEYQLEYEMTSWDQLGAQTPNEMLLADAEEEQWHFTARESWGSHQLTFGSRFQHAETDQDEEEDRWRNALTHRYNGDDFNIDSLLSYSDKTRKVDFVDSTQELLQLSNVVYWRPETEKPLTITSASLFSQSEQDSSDNKFTSIYLNGGASYQLNPNLSWLSSLSASSIENEDKQEYTEARSGLNYRSDRLPLGGFEYRWNSKLEGGFKDSEEGNGLLIVTGLGHSVYRRWPAWEGNTGLSFSQQFSDTQDKLGVDQQTLNHTASIDWTKAQNGSMTVARLSFGDNRQKTEDGTTSSQLINLQLNYNSQLSRYSRLTANGSIQGYRNDAGTGVWEVNTVFNALYQQQRLFAIKRLSFISELKLISDELSESRDRDEGFSSNFQNRNYWSNRLRYNIGRLQASFRIDLSESEGEHQVAAIFSLRRSFGGLR